MAEGTRREHHSTLSRGQAASEEPVLEFSTDPGDDGSAYETGDDSHELSNAEDSEDEAACKDRAHMFAQPDILQSASKHQQSREEDLKGAYDTLYGKLNRRLRRIRDHLNRLDFSGPKHNPAAYDHLKGVESTVKGHLLLMHQDYVSRVSEDVYEYNVGTEKVLVDTLHLDKMFAHVETLL